MREEKFEKQVREKMEQLGFDPSEAVWTQVNKEINQEKKRRPVFWLLFLPGLLMAGAAYYFVNNHPVGKIVNKPAMEISSDKQNAPSASVSANSVEKDNAEAEESNQTHKSRLIASGENAETKMSGKKLNRKTGVKKERSAGFANMPGTKGNELDPRAAASADIVVSNYNGHAAKSENQNKTLIDSSALKTVTSITENKPKKDSITSSPVTKTKEQKKKSSDWKIGYTAGAGVSNLNQNLFNSVKTLSAVNYAVGPSVPVNTAPANYSSSLISPGFSFTAGAFVNKNISDRICLSGGVNYHYYSTTIKTGIRINTTLFTSNSLNQFIASNSYYENSRSHTFTNQYHMIEIPLSVDFRLNKSKRKPFIWQLGLTPGYIVGSHALYYDPHTNVYFSNYEKPNKMQLNGTTALMFGLPFHKGQIQLGPQVQYGFTGFINSNDGNPGHLFYAGLKISFVPGKK